MGLPTSHTSYADTHTHTHTAALRAQPSIDESYFVLWLLNGECVCVYVLPMVSRSHSLPPHCSNKPSVREIQRRICTQVFLYYYYLRLSRDIGNIWTIDISPIANINQVVVFGFLLSNSHTLDSILHGRFAIGDGMEGEGQRGAERKSAIFAISTVSVVQHFVCCLLCGMETYF